MAPDTLDTPSMIDLAKRARVSKATVSRVLNGSSLVAPGTRDRVLQVAAESGYVPDPRFRLMGQARGGRLRNTGNIGALIRGISQTELVANPYYARLFWSIEQTAKRFQQHVFLATLENNTYLPDFVTGLKVDGVLFIDHVDSLLAKRVRKLLPAVIVNGWVEDAGISVLMPDETAGIRQSLQYLRGLGHERICYFDINDSINRHHHERSVAFASLVSQWGMNQARSSILRERSLPMDELAKRQLLQWREGDWRPTAIVCGSDYYALGFLNAARGLGIEVPRELSVIGNDDCEMCEHSAPRLTSVRQPLEAMGVAAVELLWQLIDGKEVPRTTQRFDVELVLRQSCGAV